MGGSQKFKQRHSISMKKIHGEAVASSVNDIDEGRQDLVESLSGYNLDNLYNMDEAALFISCNQTLRSQQKNVRHSCISLEILKRVFISLIIMHYFVISFVRFYK